MNDTNKVLQVVAVIGAVLSLVAVALVGVHLFGDSGNDTVATEQGTSAGQDADSTEAEETESEEEEPEAPELAGDWRVTGPTSDAFGSAVAQEFMRLYEKDGRAPSKLDADSPVTGLSYSMSCSEAGDEYHCTGGNDAHVYIK